MRILSIRKGFQADRSSTSYEFMAVDKRLDAKARSAASRLSSRVQPTTRRASFVYHGDWSNLPGGYDALMAKYYDVMYCESYDWWTLAFAFNTTKKDLVDKLKKGDCQPLYAVWETYGYEDEDGGNPDEAPPKPRRTKAGADIADEFANILSPME